MSSCLISISVKLIFEQFWGTTIFRHQWYQSLGTAGYRILFYVVELRMTRLRMLSNRYSLMYYKIIVLFLMNTYLSRLTWYAKELFNNEHHFPNGPDVLERFPELEIPS